MSIDKEKKHFLCEALSELKELQDSIIDYHSNYYGQLLLKIVGSDTIPFFLIMDNGVRLRITDTVKHFETEYFRIESIDKERCCGTISLLRPFDVEGNDTKSIADVVKLERTSTKISIELDCLSAIQLLNLDLLKGKIIIEPKW